MKVFKNFLSYFGIELIAGRLLRELKDCYGTTAVKSAVKGGIGRGSNAQGLSSTAGLVANLRASQYSLELIRASNHNVRWNQRSKLCRLVLSMYLPAAVCGRKTGG